YYFAFSGTALNAIPLQLVLALTVVIGLTPFIFLPGRKQGLGRWAMGLAGAMYIGMPFNYYLLLYAAGPHGLSWLGAVVATVVVADAGALLIGARVGRHPLLPLVSPKKTWEGAVGGILLALPVIIIAGWFWLHIAWWHAVILGVLIGISGIGGDLVESQMKRLARVKDSSDLIPGHGGVLDRLDSLLFAPIVTYVYASFFHLL
ncbi:MAG: phosphatidate cytidylyltransferase, partial [Candidatus Dormibacteraceae bacterium]